MKLYISGFLILIFACSVSGQKRKATTKTKSKNKIVKSQTRSEYKKYLDEFREISDKKTNKWIFLYKNEIEETYFNPSKVQMSDNGEITFWLKKIIVDKEAYWERFIKSANIIPELSSTPNLDARNSQDISHQMFF
jgi:hypothetical protein